MTDDLKSKFPLDSHPDTPSLRRKVLFRQAGKDNRDRQEGPSVRMHPVHLAAWRGDAMELQELADEGAVMLVEDNAGNTAVHWAALGQRADNIAHLLGQGHPAWKLNNKNQDALSIALETKDMKSVEVILNLASLNERSDNAVMPAPYAKARTVDDILLVLRGEISLEQARKVKKQVIVNAHGRL